MSLNVDEIRNLLRRAHLSARRGYQIALGNDYAQRLGGTDGSPMGLIELCRRALEGQAEPVEALSDDEAPPTWAPPAPVAPSVPVESSEPIPPEEPAVEAPAEEPPVERPAVETEADPVVEPVDVTVDATDELPEEGSEEEGEPEAEEAVEAGSAGVAKDPVPGSTASKRSSRRRRK